MPNPPFRPSSEQRERVGVLAASGLSEDAIARALDISRPTLRKHFREEMLTERAERRAQVLLAMYKAAIRGNVAAQKAWLKRAGLLPK